MDEGAGEPHGAGLVVRPGEPFQEQPDGLRADLLAGLEIAVSRGANRSAQGKSSKQHSARSSGTDRPRSARAHNALMVIASFR